MNDFNTISEDALATVNGGKGSTGHDMSNMDGKGSSGSSSRNDQLLQTLQGIQSSINDLSKNKNGGLFGGNNALLFMMALAFSRRSEVVVYGGRHGSGYSWRAW